MLFGETVAVYCENHMEHTLYGHYSPLWALSFLWRYSSGHTYYSPLDEVQCLASCPRKGGPVSTGYKAVWAPELIYTWNKKINLSPLGTEPQFYSHAAHGLVTVQTEPY
jgi:hypothetical protein